MDLTSSDGDTSTTAVVGDGRGGGKGFVPY